MQSFSCIALERFCNLKTDEKRHIQKITPLCHIDSVMLNLTSGLTDHRLDKLANGIAFLYRIMSQRIENVARLFRIQ